MINMSAKFDKETRNGVVSIVFKSLFPYMSIVTLTFDLWPQQEAQRATYRAPEYNVPPFWGIGQGGHLDQPKKHKLGRGPMSSTKFVEDLASC